jgi:NAD(P)-dependent dehydrogenase (short-subunit alcohol dehydrogenase family)
LSQALKTAFIVTGGLGAIGSACVRGLAAKNALVIIFDNVPEDKALAQIETLYAANVLYVETDITDIDGLNKACSKVLAQIPKGSLYGAIHCAGIAPGRIWTNKLSDSALVSRANGTTTLSSLIYRTSKRCSTSTRTAHSQSMPLLRTRSTLSIPMTGPFTHE